MEYIDGTQNDINRAFTNVLLLSFLELVSRNLQMMHSDIILKAGRRMKVGIQHAMYAKLFKISPATNKKYKKGALYSLVQKDTETITLLLSELPRIMDIPVLIIIS